MEGSIKRGQVQQNIRDIIAKKRYTVVEIAAGAGISERHLRRFLAGDTDMTLAKLDRVAAALGFTLVGLIQWRK